MSLVAEQRPQEANLVNFKAGQSGNPRGRRALGASVKDWLNIMGTWPLDRVGAVLIDPKASTCKIIAANRLLHACSTAVTEGGVPIAGPDFDRVCDRTDGKPAQKLEVANAGAIAVDLGELAERLAEMGWEPATMPAMLQAALGKRRAKVVESTVVDP